MAPSTLGESYVTWRKKESVDFGVLKSWDPAFPTSWVTKQVFIFLNLWYFICKHGGSGSLDIMYRVPVSSTFLVHLASLDNCVLGGPHRHGSPGLFSRLHPENGFWMVFGIQSWKTNAIVWLLLSKLSNYDWSFVLFSFVCDHSNLLFDVYKRLLHRSPNTHVSNPCPLMGSGTLWKVLEMEEVGRTCRK